MCDFVYEREGGRETFGIILEVLSPVSPSKCMSWSGGYLGANDALGTRLRLGYVRNPILKTHPTPMESDTLGVGPRNLACN